MVNGHLPFKSSDSKKILEAIKHPIPTKHWVSIGLNTCCLLNLKNCFFKISF